MIPRQVLVVLRKELCVLECDHLAVERFYDGRCVADAHHLAHPSVDLYPVAHLDATRHQRGAVVDVLDDILRGETDTCGESSRDGQQPGDADVEQRERDHQPHAPDEHLNHVLAHHLARGRRRGVAALIVCAQQSQDGACNPAEEEPQRDDHRQLQDRYLQVLHIDEVVFEDLPAELVEVEHLRRPVDTQHHGADAHDGHHHLLYEVVSPGLRDG